MTDGPASPMIERNLRITRVLDAPRDLVWTCWTDPEHFAAWFGPEHFHTPVESVEIDLRPGGVFKSTMVGPDGNEYPGTGTFVEVTPKDRLVFEERDIEHPMMERQHTVVSFRDLGGGRTELEIAVTMVCVEELLPMAEAGWNSSFDKLAAVLAQG
ncbi:MAG TPA: SRPBCC domain-containing protein [Solirubrobacteraceae bacterium]